LNQSFDLFLRCGTHKSDGERDVFESRARSFQAEFVRDIKGATDIDLTLLDRYAVEMREPRNLGKQSKRRAHKKIRERCWRKVGSATILWLIAFEAKASDIPFQVNIFHNVSNRAKGNFPAVRSGLDATMEFLMLQTHFF